MREGTDVSDAARGLRLPRKLRFRRIRVHVYSPVAWAMVERMQERVDAEHAWVHRLEDEIARLRNVIDQALVQCVHGGITSQDTAGKIADILRDGQQKVPRG